MIPAERAHVYVAAITHPGMSGKNNEDRYDVSAFYLDQENSVPSVLAVVADGIGGHRAGEVAAQIAVEAITQTIAASNGDAPEDTLNQAIIHASQMIFEQSERRNEQKGMGATCACCWIIENRLYTGSVGDSRIYLLRKGAIHQISIDHTWIQEAIDHGALTPEEAQGHPNAHVIRRYLGSKQQVVPDLRLRLHPEEDDLQAEANQGIHLLAGDQIILCSDGLTDLVMGDEILAILHKHSLDDALDRLVQLANQRGGHDNITIVALEMPEAPLAGAVKTPGALRRAGMACLGAGALLLVGALVLGGIYFIFRPSIPWLPGIIAQPTATTTVVTQAAPLPRSPTPFSTGISSPSPETTGVPSVSPFPSVSASAAPSATRLATTLTPWPTNTLAPTPTPSLSPTASPSATLPPIPQP